MTQITMTTPGKPGQPGKPGVRIGGAVYSPGIESGQILITSDQYQRMGEVYREDFTPVTRRGITMYRFRHAPMEAYKRTLNMDDPNDREYAEFVDLVDTFTSRFMDGIEMFTIDLPTDDDDYIYGAFSVALATVGFSEADWMIDQVFGNLYTIQKMDDEED